MFGGQAGINGHIEVGERTILGGKTGLDRTVPPGGRWIGIPARSWRQFSKEIAILQNLVEERAGKPETGKDREERG